MPLLSIEFAVFFIAFLPLYWAFARLPQVQNVLLLVAGLGWLYNIAPTFAALILAYSPLFYLSSARLFWFAHLWFTWSACWCFLKTRISANFGWVAVFQQH